MARANHPNRWVALILDTDGHASAFAKVASDEEGQRKLEQEAMALSRVTTLLEAPLRTPRLLVHSTELLLTEAVPWLPRRKPWVIPASVAAAMGSLWGTSKSGSAGIAHGDFAPWNLLRTGNDWVLVDWEGYSENSPAFEDLFHYVVQSHCLLGRPTANDIFQGLDGGHVLGGAFEAYGEAAGVASDNLDERLAAYLRKSLQEISGTPGDPRGRTGREALLARLER